MELQRLLSIETNKLDKLPLNGAINLTPNDAIAFQTYFSKLLEIATIKLAWGSTVKGHHCHGNQQLVQRARFLTSVIRTGNCVFACMALVVFQVADEPRRGEGGMLKGHTTPGHYSQTVPKHATGPPKRVKNLGKCQACHHTTGTTSIIRPPPKTVQQ